MIKQVLFLTKRLSRESLTNVMKGNMAYLSPPCRNGFSTNIAQRGLRFQRRMSMSRSRDIPKMMGKLHPSGVTRDDW